MVAAREGVKMYTAAFVVGEEEKMTKLNKIKKYSSCMW